MDALIGAEEQYEEQPKNGPIADAHARVRLGFIKKVYAILGMQMLLTFAIAAPIQLLATPEWLMAHMTLFYIAAVAPLVMLVMGMCCFPKVMKNYPTNYIFLIIFTCFQAFTVGCVSSLYTTQSVMFAMATTGAVTLGLSIYAANTKSDFTGCAPFFWAITIGLLCFMSMMVTFQMLGFVLPRGAQLAYSGFAVGIYCLYIVHDTQMIVGTPLGLFGQGKQHKTVFMIDDYVFAALNLYIDIIGLFLQLLEIMGDKK